MSRAVHHEETASMQNAEAVWRLADEKSGIFAALSDRVWATREVNFQEQRSAAEHIAALREQGFRLESGLAGMPTAFTGEAGEGGPVIAVLGEFDALPGLSQEAGTAEQRAVEPGGNGHACGHNMLGAASLLAGGEGSIAPGKPSSSSCAAA